MVNHRDTRRHVGKRKVNETTRVKLTQLEHKATVFGLAADLLSILTCDQPDKGRCLRCRAIVDLRTSQASFRHAQTSLRFAGKLTEASYAQEVGREVQKLEVDALEESESDN